MLEDTWTEKQEFVNSLSSDDIHRITSVLDDNSILSREKLDFNKLEVAQENSEETCVQTDVSEARVKALAKAIVDVGTMLQPIILIRAVFNGEKTDYLVSGRHRFAALKTIEEKAKGQGKKHIRTITTIFNCENEEQVKFVKYYLVDQAIEAGNTSRQMTTVEKMVRENGKKLEAKTILQKVFKLFEEKVANGGRFEQRYRSPIEKMIRKAVMKKQRPIQPKDIEDQNKAEKESYIWMSLYFAMSQYNKRKHCQCIKGAYNEIESPFGMITETNINGILQQIERIPFNSVTNKQVKEIIELYLLKEEKTIKEDDDNKEESSIDINEKFRIAAENGDSETVNFLIENNIEALSLETLRYSCQKAVDKNFADIIEKIKHFLT